MDDDDRLIQDINNQRNNGQINLENRDLTGAVLNDVDLRRANLRNVDLRDAYLSGANLRGANLMHASLRRADLTNVDLTNANLTDADLSGANLTNADLTDADLTNVNMEGATLRDTLGLEPRRRLRIDANQVHRESAKINYPKLIAFLKEKLPNINIPVNINYASYINESISYLINKSNETPDKKREQQAELQRLMNDRLNRFNYGEVSEDVRNSIYYVLEYVKRQPSDFQKIYIDNWLESCITDAYAGGEISCVVGVIERFIFALSNACIFSLSSGENAEYEMINSIIRQNPNVLIPEYIQDWYKLHKKGSENAFPPETTATEKKENLRNYLLERLPDSTKLIDDKILEIADNIGYEEDDFLYGGRRRRRRKNRKTTKKIRRKSNKKRKTKRRKTMRHAS